MLVGMDLESMKCNTTREFTRMKNSSVGTMTGAFIETRKWARVPAQTQCSDDRMNRWKCIDVIFEPLCLRHSRMHHDNATAV
jgi:hypothetical protein